MIKLKIRYTQTVNFVGKLNELVLGYWCFSELRSLYKLNNTVKT